MSDSFQKAAFAAAFILVLGCGALIYKSAHSKTVSPTYHIQSTHINLAVQPLIIVHIGGAVAHPGVYQLKEGTRVMELIQMAGGAYPNADLDKLKLASRLKEGQHIFVKLKEGARKRPITSFNPEPQFPISISQITPQALSYIPRLSERVIQKIMAYKEAHPMMQVEDLRHIPGIGEKTYQKLRLYLY